MATLRKPERQMIKYLLEVVNSMISPDAFVEEAIANLKETVTGKTIIATSGGVDSTVAAVICNRALRANPVWREGFVTDNGNHILDVHDLNISNPLEMETRLNQIPGIITVGLFAHRPADILLIAEDSGVRELRT